MSFESLFKAGGVNVIRIISVLVFVKENSMIYKYKTIIMALHGDFGSNVKELVKYKIISPRNSLTKQNFNIIQNPPLFTKNQLSLKEKQE